MILRAKWAIVAAGALIFGGIGCGGEDDRDADGSGEVYVEVCGQHILDCTDADDPDDAEAVCEQSWASLEEQTDHPADCESAWVVAYECRIDELCPVDEVDDEDDACQQEHAEAGMACFGN